jgi:hypothetical protein
VLCVNLYLNLCIKHFVLKIIEFCIECVLRTLHQVDDCNFCVLHRN